MPARSAFPTATGRGLLQGLSRRGQEAEDDGSPLVLRLPRIGPPREVRQHPEWLISSPKKEMVGRSIRPSGVRAYEISLMLEVARKYDVDWIHLDYIRYPCEPTEPFFSFDPETLRLFRADTGIDMGAVKARDTGNMAWNAWLRWNSERSPYSSASSRKLSGRQGSGSRSARPSFPTPSTPGHDRPGLGALAARARRHAQSHALYERRPTVREARRRGRGHRRGRALVCPGSASARRTTRTRRRAWSSRCGPASGSRSMASSISRPRASTSPSSTP